MPTARPKSSERYRDDFFNDPPENDGNNEQSPESSKDGAGENQSPEGGEGYVPRPKRIACILCRKRKLRCDGTKPSCSTCSRLGHDCAYDEVRKKSGPKRGYVKLLEARLKQVETLLESRDANDGGVKSAVQRQEVSQQPNFADMSNINLSSTTNMAEFLSTSDIVDPSLTSMMPDFGLGAGDDFSWEMIGLGLDEPLPSQDIIDDMNQIFFEKVHPSLPMIHQPRFFAAMNLAPHMRPPVCLRYAMWTQVCSVTPRYSALMEHFYARARKYAEQDEMRGHGESMITIAHSQCWTLIACYEFKVMMFPRAWMSCGRATRLAQMMGLHRQDGLGLDVKQTLPPPRDWTEREERRRTFWMAFCQDRYASIGTGWPMTIDEQDILTNLPSTEEAFNRSKPEPTVPLSEAMTGDGASTLSPFAGVILMACLFGRNLTHLHRPNAEDRDHDLNGEFWQRHRALDNILLNTSLSLPAHLRLPAGLGDSNIVFCNMNIHTSTICLHQAAIFKADKNRMPAQISAESKRRCIIAADQITNIMKMSSHIDLFMMNPFVSFCLYVASRVFVQYLKSRKDDMTVRSSLLFLLSAMQALKAKNPLTESFLVQLEVDLDGSGLGIQIPQGKYGLRVPGEIPVNTDSLKCSPLYEIRESQVQGQNAQLAPQERPIRTTSDTPMDFSAVPPYENASTAGAIPQRAKAPMQTGPPWPTEAAADANSLYPPQNANVMDVSPDPSGDGRQYSRPHSGHPTPSSSSNKTSPNTDYTSSQLDDGSHKNYTSRPITMSPKANPHSIYQVEEIYPAQFQPPFGDQVEDLSLGAEVPLAMNASWEYSNNGRISTGTGLARNPTIDISSARTGLTPGPTGMTPLSMPDANWQGMALMDGNEWMYGQWNDQSPQQ